MATNDPNVEARRVSFRDGQVLHAADLRAEQRDRVVARRRHNVVAHRAGIVSGLVLQANGDDVLIGPGMALDGAGREILVTSSSSIGDGLCGALLQLYVSPSDGAALDVWLVYVETPGDGEGVPTPTTPPDRYREAFRLRFTRSGDQNGANDPAQGVFLGTLVWQKEHSPLWQVLGLNRVFVSAPGGEVLAASRRGRLILAPEDADDPRRFTVATRAGDGLEYADRLAIHADGGIHLAGGASVQSINTNSSDSTVTIAHRGVAVGNTDLRSPLDLVARLAGAPEGSALGRIWSNPVQVDDTKYITEEEKRLLQYAMRIGSVSAQGVVALARLLNRAIFDSKVGLVDALNVTEQQVLRADTARLLLAQRAGSPRANPPRLVRLILEDLLPGLLARLPCTLDGPLGVAFAAGRPEPKQALPGRVYRAVIKDKEGKKVLREELRFEFLDPGKEGDPANFHCTVGAASRRGADGNPVPFAPCLIVAADRTVTVTGNLTVNGGQLIQSTPSTDPNDPVSRARLLAAVSPGDFILSVNSVKSGPGTGTVATVTVRNTGQAPILAVQVNGVANKQNDTSAYPRFQFTTGFTLDAGATHQEDVVLTGLTTAAGNVVQFDISAVGIGPANNVLQARFQGPVTVS